MPRAFSVISDCRHRYLAGAGFQQSWAMPNWSIHQNRQWLRNNSPAVPVWAALRQRRV